MLPSIGAQLDFMIEHLMDKVACLDEQLSVATNRLVALESLRTEAKDAKGGALDVKFQEFASSLATLMLDSVFAYVQEQLHNQMKLVSSSVTSCVGTAMQQCLAEALPDLVSTALAKCKDAHIVHPTQTQTQAAAPTTSAPSASAPTASELAASAPTASVPAASAPTTLAPPSPALTTPTPAFPAPFLSASTACAPAAFAPAAFAPTSPAHTTSAPTVSVPAASAPKTFAPTAASAQTAAAPTLPASFISPRVGNCLHQGSGCSAQQFEVGDVVVIHGLTKSTELNQQIGVIIGFAAVSDRFIVDLIGDDDKPSGKIVRVKETNLISADEAENLLNEEGDECATDSKDRKDKTLHLISGAASDELLTMTANESSPFPPLSGDSLGLSCMTSGRQA